MPNAVWGATEVAIGHAPLGGDLGGRAELHEIGGGVHGALRAPHERGACLPVAWRWRPPGFVHSFDAADKTSCRHTPEHGGWLDMTQAQLSSGNTASRPHGNTGTGDARQHGHPSNPRQDGWVGSAACCVFVQLSRTLSPLTSVLRSLTRSEHARGGCLVGSVGRWGGHRARPSPGCLYARGSPHTPGAREGLPQLLISHARFHSPVCAEASR